jgi:hypothetical protein
MFNTEELLQSKEFWDEIYENSVIRIINLESNVEQESEHLWKHIDTLIKILSSNERESDRKHSKAKEFCDHKKSKYDYKTGGGKCTKCGKLIGI